MELEVEKILEVGELLYSSGEELEQLEMLLEPIERAQVAALLAFNLIHLLRLYKAWMITDPGEAATKLEALHLELGDRADDAESEADIAVAYRLHAMN